MMLAVREIGLSAPAQPAQSRLGLWLLWVVTTTLGWWFGSIVVLVILESTSGGADAFVRGGGSALLGAICGFVISSCQWLALRRELRAVRGWILVTTAAWAIAWAVGQTITDALLDDYWLLGLLPGGVLLASIVGLSQWVFLRRHLRHASLWLPATLIGWAVAGIVSMYGGGGLVGVDLAAFVGALAWIIAAMPGAVAGMVTGAVLVGLLSRSARII